MSDIDYQLKYFKYKKKYLNLKKNLFGADSNQEKEMEKSIKEALNMFQDGKGNISPFGLKKALKMLGFDLEEDVIAQKIFRISMARQHVDKEKKFAMGARVENKDWEKGYIIDDGTEWNLMQPKHEETAKRRLTDFYKKTNPKKLESDPKWIEKLLKQNKGKLDSLFEKLYKKYPDSTDILKNGGLKGDKNKLFMYVARSETDPKACGKIIEISRDKLSSAGDDFPIEDYELLIEKATDALELQLEMNEPRLNCDIHRGFRWSRRYKACVCTEQTPCEGIGTKEAPFNSRMVLPRDL